MYVLYVCNILCMLFNQITKSCLTLYKAFIHYTVVTSSVTRQSASVIKVGVAYVNVYVSRLVSHRQTAFPSFIFGREEKGSGERSIQFLFSKSPLFGDFINGF